VEQKFKEISQAYGILGDSDKRRRFDRGEIDASGQETAAARAGSGFYRAYADGGQGTKYTRFECGPEFDVEDIFSDLFSRRGAQRGADVNYAIKVSFQEAALGAKKRIRLAEGKTLDVTIQPGTENGQTLRLKGQGRPGQAKTGQAKTGRGGTGRGRASAGDAFIQVEVVPHPYFVRDGRDIRLDLPITLKEAVLGASVQVPTIHGKVAMKIPPGANSGRTLRLKGKGVPAGKGQPAGDQFVRLAVMLPDEPDEALKGFVEGWPGGDRYDPRRKAGLG
ncbi:MAG: DnaJ C-terminal domain-containing protein, partial [Kiloniellales bacterium]